MNSMEQSDVPSQTVENAVTTALGESNISDTQTTTTIATETTQSTKQVMAIGGQFLGKLIILLLIVYFLAVATPYIARKIDGSREKHKMKSSKPKKPLDSRIYEVKSIYDAQSSPDTEADKKTESIQEKTSDDNPKNVEKPTVKPQQTQNKTSANKKKGSRKPPKHK